MTSDLARTIKRAPENEIMDAMFSGRVCFAPYNPGKFPAIVVIGVVDYLITFKSLLSKFVLITIPCISLVKLCDL